MCPVQPCVGDFRLKPHEKVDTLKTIIHVNQHIIKANKKRSLEEAEPVLSVKTYKDNRYTSNAIIRDADGREVARVVYRPHNPLSCGAHCWIETHLQVDSVDISHK